MVTGFVSQQTIRQLIFRSPAAGQAQRTAKVVRRPTENPNKSYYFKEEQPNFRYLVQVTSSSSRVTTRPPPSLPRCLRLSNGSPPQLNRTLCAGQEIEIIAGVV